MSLVRRGPWLGIELGTSRSRSQHSTTRLLRRQWILHITSIGKQRALSLDIWPNPTIGSLIRVPLSVDNGSFYIKSKCLNWVKHLSTLFLGRVWNDMWLRGSKLMFTYTCLILILLLQVSGCCFGYLFNTWVSDRWYNINYLFHRVVYIAVLIR